MGTKLVVFGLPWDVDSEGLRKHMVKFGPLEDCVVMKDRLSGRSRGFGYVTFSSADDVKVGGNSYQVPAGRRDGNVSVAGETNGNLPPPTANVNQLNQIFGSKGLTQAQMVALSGAHTVGMAQCSSFSSRLYSYGTSGGKDPSMDPTYLATLSTQCPQSGASQPVAMDPVTPNTFDTNYYANVAANRGLLASDQALLADNSTAAQVLGYTTNPGTFQTDFANAMVAMGAIGVLTGNTGTIRTNCRVVG